MRSGIVGLESFAKLLSAAPVVLRKLIARVARKPPVAVAVSFLLPLLLRLAVWPVLKEPTPSVQDEFSHLLIADTFAHGRLANPTHPLWRHFETIHVLQHPTYSSIYPFMQGTFLAFGQMLFHDPWGGVVVSVGLMCAAICWALQAWLPPAWALAGGVLASLQFGVASYWMNSYWGGAAAALGGALVVGAVPRVLRGANPANAVVLAIGFAVLANSRPYEGFFFSLPAAIALLSWIFGAERFCRWLGFRSVVRPPFRTIAVRMLIPFTIVLIVTAIFMGYYFWRVTGDPLTMPYVVAARQYGVTPLFIWQKLRPAPSYNDDRLRYFYTRTAPQMRLSERVRGRMYWEYYLGVPLSVPLILMLPWVLRARQTRFFLIAAGITALALALEWWSFPHYAAPATIVIYGLLLQSCRYLKCVARRLRWQQTGRVILAAVVAAFLAQVAFAVAKRVVIAPLPSRHDSMNIRAALERRLKAQGRKHLVLVRYSDHNREPAVHQEWIYNAADIDDSQIVWARELGGDQDRRLREYYKGRQMWLVDPDKGTIAAMR